MLVLLQEFVADPTCFSMKVTEQHIVQAMKYTKTEWVWLTGMDIKLSCKAYAWKEGAEYAEKLMKGSKATKKHPLFPKDDSMKMYKVLKTLMEGFEKKAGTIGTIEVSGEAAEASEELVATMKGRMKSITANGDSPRSPKERTVKPKKSTTTPKKRSVKPKPAAKTATRTVDMKDHSSTHSVKMVVKRAIASLAGHDGRQYVACREMLGTFVPILETYECRFEAAEVANTDSSEIATEVANDCAAGKLRLLQSELEFAHTRLELA